MSEPNLVGDLFGQLLATQAMLKAIIRVLPPERLGMLEQEFEKLVEAERTGLEDSLVEDEAVAGLHRTALALNRYSAVRRVDLGYGRS